MIGAFDVAFGRSPHVTADAPGRVNLIGEHTDYNDGYVLPCAIPQRTRVALARRYDTHVSLRSRELGEGAYDIGREQRTATWIDYVQGMTAALARAGSIGGFDAWIESDVPVGAGLSSSAALEIAIGRALRQAFRLDVDDLALARAAQRAENQLVGAPVGLMDQMASSLGDVSSALLIDMRTLECSRVVIPATLELIVMHSGIGHEHARGQYAERRRECEAAAQRLGVSALRDLSADDLPRVERLPDPLRQRVRHVVTENARVLDAVRALRAGDRAVFGRLLNASHQSLRDDYAVSIPEIDRLVDLAASQAGVFGARLTGGGFGGSIVAAADRGTASEAARHIAAAYHAQAGRAARILLPRLSSTA